MNAVQFSVVIPLFNKVESVSRTLQSICQQRFPASEIIVVDDGSTDGSAEKVLQLGLPNVKLIKQTNQGVSAARNKGVAFAKYNYIAFMDADDQWSPFYLYEMNKLIKRFRKHEFFASGYQKVCGEGMYTDPKIIMPTLPPEGGILDSYFDVAARGDLPFMTSSTVITRKLFIKLGGFPVGETMGEDQELFSQAAIHSSIVYSPLVLLLYHVDSENRACDRHLPSEPLPFAQRLLANVANGNITEPLINPVLSYCAAHVCNLAKLNLQAGNEHVAMELLKHEISKQKPLHRSIFTLWSMAKLIFTYAAVLMHFKQQSANANSK